MLPTASLGEEFGADSAKAPQVTHQKTGPLLTVLCFLKGAAVAMDRSYACTAHLTTVLPLHVCGASLSQVRDLVRHTVHHQPVSVVSRVWPPLAGLLAVMLVLAVGAAELGCWVPVALAAAAAAALVRRLAAAASAALAARPECPCLDLRAAGRQGRRPLLSTSRFGW